MKHQTTGVKSLSVKQNKDLLNAIEGKARVETLLYPAWIDFEELRKRQLALTKSKDKEEQRKGKFFFTLWKENHYGKYQKIFRSRKGEISLIKILNDHITIKNNNKNRWCYEIFAYDNPKLFTDVIRYDTEEEAIKKIKELLED